MDIATHQLADLLLAIEAEMRRIGLWEAEQPTEEALSSLAPFAYDSLEFHQWLQWVFLPKSKEIVEQGRTWPARSDIYPIAEHVFAEVAANANGLLQLIRRFDELINQQSR